MRSVSPPPSTPAGLRGTEWVTDLSPGGTLWDSGV